MLLTAPSAVPMGTPWALGVSSYHGRWVLPQSVGLQVPPGLLWAAICGLLGPLSLGRAVRICARFSQVHAGLSGLGAAPSPGEHGGSRGPGGLQRPGCCPAQGLPLLVLCRKWGLSCPVLPSTSCSSLCPLGRAVDRQRKRAVRVCAADKGPCR